MTICLLSAVTKEQLNGALALCFLLLVPFHVQRQVIGARKASPAHQAFEGLSAGVLSHVPRQFVRSGKSPVASSPRAGVRFFT